MHNSLIYNHLYEWYQVNRRILPWRETDDPYAIWLSEVILQQTRVLQGLDYYLRFIARWPKVEDLAAADESEVLREWQGLGYYSRARNLHKAAQMIVERGWTPFPTRFEDIRALPGVGDYTAGAIASFAYNQPYPAMDGNVYRVVARLLDIDEPFDTTAGKKLFHRHLEALLDRDHPRLFNSAIMEFGALQCTPVLSDNCVTCPLQTYCAAYVHGTAELLPVRKPRPKVRDRWFTYHIYVKSEGVKELKSEGEVYTLIQKRENPKDIWYHLYEFPCEESKSPITNHQSPVTGNPSPLNTNPSSLFLQRSGPYSFSAAVSLTHILSHQKLHAQFLVHAVDELPNIPGTIVIRWDELNDYALSRLTLRALDTLQLSPLG